MARMTEVSIEDFKAKVVMIANELHIPQTIIKHMKVGVRVDEELDRLIYRIKSYITASGEESVNCDLRWPSDWWQAAKERWFPRWAQKRWPVHYNIHRVDRTFYRAMCPHIDIPFHQGNEVHFRFLKEHDGS